MRHCIRTCMETVLRQKKHAFFAFSSQFVSMVQVNASISNWMSSLGLLREFRAVLLLLYVYTAVLGVDITYVESCCCCLIVGFYCKFGLAAVALGGGWRVAVPYHSLGFRTFAVSLEAVDIAQISTLRPVFVQSSLSRALFRRLATSPWLFSR